MKTLLVAIALLTGCVTEDEPPPPTCEEIGAPDSLLCSAGGLCAWDGVECCAPPRLGAAADPKCEGVTQSR